MSKITLHEPYVVATLPRPLDQSGRIGKYHCAEVHGSTPGSRKRKRELAIGIDGEGVNIYDTTGSKLVTTYALPSQSVLTCPPCSVKSRTSKSGAFVRQTYVSTTASTPQLALFHDKSLADGGTSSTTIRLNLDSGSPPIVYIDTIAQVDGFHLLAVLENGDLECRDGVSLELRWRSTVAVDAAGDKQLIASRSESPTQVQFCQVLDAYSACRGILADCADITAVFPQPISPSGYNPDILAVITLHEQVRLLKLLVLPQNNSNGINKSSQCISMQALPETVSSHSAYHYELHAAKGLLYESRDRIISIRDLKYSAPRLLASITFEHPPSLLGLSGTQLAVACSGTVQIINPLFGSVLALANSSNYTTISLSQIAEASTSVSNVYRLLSYGRNEAMIHALRGDELVAIQLDLGSNGAGQHRELGLLIDSINRGRIVADCAEHAPIMKESDLPTSLLESSKQGDVVAFEAGMAKLLGMQVKKVVHNATPNGADAGTAYAPEWIWPTTQSGYKPVDQFYVKFALRAIFEWDTTMTGGSPPPHLRIAFYPPNVVKWLILTKNLHRSNIESAIRSQLIDSQMNCIPAGHLVEAFLEADPEMDTLFALISNTYMDACELMMAMKSIMMSLELFGADNVHRQALITNSMDHEEHEDLADLEQRVEREAEVAKRELQLAEFRLSEGSGLRAQALGAAVAKLHNAPTQDVVKAIRSIFTFEQIVALIYLLRFELVRGSWTARYLDANKLVDESTASQNSNAILITNLLNNCVDAIGTGGWLGGEAMLAPDSHFESEELIADLKLEVTAALRGVEESAYLREILLQMLRYSESLPNSVLSTANKTTAMPGKDQRHATPRLHRRTPFSVPQIGVNTSILPYGLKAASRISLKRIGAGGEVYRRSARDIGRLKSRKVGKYSRERIVL